MNYDEEMTEKTVAAISRHINREAHIYLKHSTRLEQSFYTPEEREKVIETLDRLEKIDWSNVSTNPVEWFKLLNLSVSLALSTKSFIWLIQDRLSLTCTALEALRETSLLWEGIIPFNATMEKKERQRLDTLISDIEQANDITWDLIDSLSTLEEREEIKDLLEPEKETQHD